MVGHGGALVDTRHGGYQMGHGDHLELTVPRMVFPFPGPTRLQVDTPGLFLRSFCAEGVHGHR